MRLFEPIRIGNMELRNRLVMAPMSCNLGKDGFVTERMIRFFEERAKGGVGLIVIGDGIVESPIGNNVKESTAVDDDKYIPMLRRLTEAVRAYGANIALQLSHAGRRGGRVNRDGFLDVTGGKIPVAPSPLPHPVPGYVVPRELSQEEIGEIVARFGEAARRTMEAGFDAIGLHCAHMYLCGQFLSPWANQRMDGYGGDIEGRIRFVQEVIGAIRAKVGGSVPLIVRMNGQEPDGGNTLKEIRYIARRLEEFGVDSISVSVGFGAPVKTSGFIPSVAPMRAPDACIVPLSENIKSGITIPVAVANKIGDVRLAERILAEGKADLIAMGRPLIADPYLPQKALEGRLDEIVPCIFCGQGCIQRVLERDEAITCTVNPAAAKEGETRLSKAPKGKRVVVLGGGPGGLVASRVAAERGHHVELYEKSSELGGQLRLASLPPGKQGIQRLAYYLLEGVRKAEVTVFLEKEFTLAVAAGVDALVVATGSRPVIPTIPGVDRRHVVIAGDVLLGRAAVGDPVVVIGGGQVGAEVAEFLAEEGRNVTILEIAADIAQGMPSIARLPLLCHLDETGVRIWTKARVREIRDDAVDVEYKGAPRQVLAATVVIATGAEPNVGPVEVFRGKIPEVYVIGDSARPRSFLEAIAEGFDVGSRL